MNFRTVSSYLFVVVILAATYLASTNMQAIQDWWFLRSYTPSSEIQRLADDSFLSDRGEDLFFVSDPEINQSAEFNENCPFRERSYVLGCYSGERIYIFDVTDERLDGIKEVTAAHEMLHAAYGRFSVDELDDLKVLLDRQLEQIDEARIIDLIDQYRQQDPDSIYNEMHSIFGTEVQELLPELETHFAQFFDDRAKLVQISLAYEAVFEELRQQADQQLASIEAARAELERLEAVITTQKNQIQTLETELDLLDQEIQQARANTDAAAEQAAVTIFNTTLEQLRSVITIHNNNVVRFNDLVANINAQVESYNALVGEQEALVDSIDSKKETVETQ